MGDSTASGMFQGETTFTADCGLSTQPIPLEPYRSHAFFEKTRDNVFGRAWLLMGRVEEIPEHGDYVVRRIEPNKVSALLLRDKAGEVRAYYNSCSHRGSEVTAADQGNRKRIVCPYHNWTYGTDGALLGIPDEESFFGIDKSKCGLTPMSCGVWEGWMFINLQKQPEVSLVDFLGEFRHHLEGVNYIAVQTPVTVTADLEANWKVVVDAFIESYHIPAIHPRTIASTFSSDENRFARLLDAKVFGPHRSVSMYGNPALALDPENKVEVLAYSNSGTDSLIAAGASDAMRDFLAHPSVNPTGSSSWSMDVNHMFPNTQIDFGPGGFWVHQFWPLSANTSRYEVKFYVPEALNVRQRLQQELYVSRVVEVVLEDLDNVARTQRGIDSGGKDYIQLQDSEVGIRHSTLQVIKWAEAGTVAEAMA
jgi:phenylpropionate dioxygenase-like ring-hydroxylating dioxygenase large terminal subunit